MGLVGGGLTHQFLGVEIETDNVFLCFIKNLMFCLAQHHTANIGLETLVCCAVPVLVCLEKNGFS